MSSILLSDQRNDEVLRRQRIELQCAVNSQPRTVRRLTKGLSDLLSAGFTPMAGPYKWSLNGIDYSQTGLLPYCTSVRLTLPKVPLGLLLFEHRTAMWN